MKHGIVITILGMFICAVVYWSVSSLNFLYAVTLVADRRLSPLCQTLLYDDLQLSIQKKKSIHETISDIKNASPYVKNITVACRPTGSLVHVFCYKPICSINESFVLLENGEIVDSSLFSCKNQHTLPSVYCAQENNRELLSVASQLITLLPKDIQTYTITIENKHNITLHHKNDPLFTIKCALDHTISSDLFNQCEKVKNYALEQKMFDNNVAWVADTRFAHYIVAYRA